MTYRQKAEQLLMERLGVSEDIAPDIVRLLEQEGEYIPAVLPAVFGGLEVSYDLEDWDAEIPEESEEKNTSTVFYIVRAEDPAAARIDFCILTESGYRLANFRDVCALKQWLAEQEQKGNRCIIVDSHDNVISVDEFVRRVNAWPNE